MKRINFIIDEPISTDLFSCDCCGEGLALQEIFHFDGSEIDSLYEYEHLCASCAAILPEVDFLAAAYEQVRNYKYLQYRIITKKENYNALETQTET